MLICGRCGQRGGGWILAHVFLHILDLIIVGVVASVLSGVAVQKFGWMGILLGAVMGIGLGSFRERGLSRIGLEHPAPPPFTLGPPPPAEDAARIGDVGQG